LTRELNFRIKKDRELRVLVFVRDKFTCQRCGVKPNPAPSNYDGTYTIFNIPKGTYLVVDHIKPRKKGGSKDPSNLQTLCDSCNKAKGDSYGPN